MAPKAGNTVKRGEAQKAGKLTPPETGNVLPHIVQGSKFGNFAKYNISRKYLDKKLNF